MANTEHGPLRGCSMFNVKFVKGNTVFSGKKLVCTSVVQNASLQLQHQTSSQSDWTCKACVYIHCTYSRRENTEEGERERCMSCENVSQKTHSFYFSLRYRSPALVFSIIIRTLDFRVRTVYHCAIQTVPTGEFKVQIIMSIL